MNKDLFEILQEIKLEINKIENNDKENSIESLNKELDNEIKNYNNCSKKQFYIKLKYNLLKLLTLGIYGHFKKNKIYEKIEELENYMFESENNYNMLNIEIIINEELNKINKNRKISLDKNYNQISSFLSLYDKSNSDEKSKILEYKMGVSNE